MCLTADLYLLFLTLFAEVCFFTLLILLIADFVFGMVDSLYIWVGDVKAQNMNNLVTAMQSRYDTNAPLTTAIINGPLDTTAEEFSSRLNLRASLTHQEIH